MSMIRIPEFILLDTVQKLLNFVRVDFQSAATEQDSYLYKTLTGSKIERYDFYTQGKKIFLALEDDPRLLKVDLMYNMDIDKVPSIYITLPSEQNGQNGMGVDEGYQEAEIEDMDINGLGGSFTSVFTRRFNTTYSLMIISDNSNEVILIYHFLKALLISAHAHLNLSGIENIALGGQDIQLNSDRIPKHLFMRALTLNIQYETSSLDLRSHPMLGSILAKGKPTGFKSDEFDTPNNENDL